MWKKNQSQFEQPENKSNELNIYSEYLTISK